MGAQVSDKAQKVARNTVFLYIRMLFLMLIGLFTSRVVVNALGFDDYGIYGAVSSIVMMFTVISNSISTSIGRFLAYEIGAGNEDGLKKVFSSALIIQAGLCIVLFLLAETVGLWYLKSRLVIPAGRETAAFWVFQASAVMLAIQLLSIPFNSVIIARERMKAFAWISIVEGVLKLSVALALYLSGSDKLVLYALLMVLAAALVRSIYALYCRRHFAETRGPIAVDTGTIRPMLSMGAWSFTAHGVGVFNTQGVNLLSNASFGVGINAIRGIAGQIENIVKQFVTNFLTALNPLIVKSWAEGNKDYCFTLVGKGCKFSYLIVLLFLVPFCFEADFILRVWLGKVPDGAALFTVLAIVCVMLDMMSNSLAQLVISKGKVAVYYLVTSAISSFTFIFSWIAFRKGCPALSSYCISAAILLLIALSRLVVSRRLCGLPVRRFVRQSVVPIILCTVLSFAFGFLTCRLIPSFWTLKPVAVIFLSLLFTVLSVYAAGLSKGERSYVNDIIRKVLRRK